MLRLNWTDIPIVQKVFFWIKCSDIFWFKITHILHKSMYKITYMQSWWATLVVLICLHHPLVTHLNPDRLQQLCSAFWFTISVTRLSDFLHFGKVFKAIGNNYFIQIFEKVSKSFILLVKSYLGNFYRDLAIFSGHTDQDLFYKTFFLKFTFKWTWIKYIFPQF